VFIGVVRVVRVPSRFPAAMAKQLRFCGSYPC
jgi:hypothetical protein